MKARKILALALVWIVCAGSVALQGCGGSGSPKGPSVGGAEEFEALSDTAKVLIGRMSSTGKFVSEQANVVTTFDGDKMSRGDAYYFLESNKNYVIDKIDEKWTKDFSDVEVLDEKLEVENLFDINFKNLENKKLVGSWANGTKVTLEIDDEQLVLDANGRVVTVSQIGTAKVELPTVEVDKTVAQQMTQAEAVEMIRGIAKKIAANKNFSAVGTSNGQPRELYLQGDKALLKMGDDLTETYYEKDKDGKIFEYVLSGDEWRKQASEQDYDSFASMFTQILDGFEATAFDAEAKKLSGSASSGDTKRDVEITLLDNGIELAYGTTNVRLFNVDNTKVNAPENYLDATQPSEKIFSDVDGKREYNMPLLAKAIEEWFEESDYNSVLWRRGGHLDKVLYVTVDEENNQINLGTFITSNSTSGIVVLIKSTSRLNISEMFVADNNSFDGIKNYFTKIQRPFALDGVSIEPEYTSLNATEEQKNWFNAATEKIFDKAVSVGYQGGSIRNPGTPVPELDGAEVLFWFKTANSAELAFGDIGNGISWDNYYILKDFNMNLQFVKVHLAVNNDLDNIKAADKILDGKYQNWWFVSSCGMENIDKNNEKIFRDLQQEESMTKI